MITFCCFFMIKLLAWVFWLYFVNVYFMVFQLIILKIDSSRGWLSVSFWFRLEWGNLNSDHSLQITVFNILLAEEFLPWCYNNCFISRHLSFNTYDTPSTSFWLFYGFDPLFYIFVEFFKKSFFDVCKTIGNITIARTICKMGIDRKEFSSG